MKSPFAGARARDAVLPAAFFVVSALLRAALLVEKDVQPRLADVHGFVADAFVACALAAIATLLFRRRRLALLLLVPWAVGSYATYEFTKTMNALPPWQSIRYLGDGTFLRGSAFVVSNVALLVAALVIPAAVVWLALRGAASADDRTRWARLRPLAPPLAIAAVAFVAWPDDRGILDWRQTNALASNVADYARPSSSRTLPPLTPAQQTALDRAFHADLGGADVVPSLPKKTNVLLVLLESISGMDLPSVAALHRHPRPDAPMPELDAIGNRNVFFRTFITHQRGTNRGLYASLCGQYPKLSTATAKMTELAARDGELECLPSALRREGYETVFLQAAPLAFMLKDAFMPKIGFSKTFGAEVFDKGYARSNWGVDDRTFFERAREKVRDLRSGGRPWMMTLLTVGTHHPYPVPKSFESPEPEGSYARAARYADRAVAELIHGLEEDGALEDTVVLVTSDESRGIDHQGDDLTTLFTQNLSFMIALLPTRQHRIVDEMFAQSDTALSVLDVLGLADEAMPFIGRSIFRAYAAPRRVFVANQNTRTVAMLGSRQSNAWMCDEHLRECNHLHLEHPEGVAPSFLAPERAMSEASQEDVALLAAAKARAEGETSSPHREMRLTGDRLVNVVDPDGQLLFAGQYIDLPSDSILDIDLEVDAVGTKSDARLAIDVVANAGALELGGVEPFVVSAGESVSLRLSHRPPPGTTTLRYVEVRATAFKGEGNVAVRFSRAILRVRPATAKDATGFRERERHVRRIVD